MLPSPLSFDKLVANLSILSAEEPSTDFSAESRFRIWFTTPVSPIPFVALFSFPSVEVRVSILLAAPSAEDCTSSCRLSTVTSLIKIPPFYGIESND